MVKIWAFVFGLAAIGAAARADEWRPLFVGIDRMQLEMKDPRPLKVNALRIDLKAKGIKIVTTPSNGDAPGETTGMRTSSFLRELKCQVAINAAPFAPIHLVEGKAQDVSGLMVSDGEKVSPKTTLPILWFGEKNTATISRAVKTNVEGKIVDAVSGFHIVLEKGEVKGSDAPLHPRTAAAISKDGRFLILVVIDGRQKGYSEGASTREVGSLLKRLGGWSGINLDGGGTTTMVIEGDDGKPKVVNRPIHGGIPGMERVAASHLGIRARPLN